ncbi:MAG: sulfurtransferase TusA family protein [Gammaproteobacteria bacterium]|nr:sulfurtransferase TusA family protein [Gammaproteobacteria bacterium]
MSGTFEIDKTIDTCGTRCPIPLLRAKQALREMPVGDLLQVFTTDPGAEADFKAMLKHLPHELLSFEAGLEGDSNTPRIDTFVIRKG